MGKPAQLEGRRFNRLVVVTRRGSMPKSGASRWECICDCGRTCYYAAADLTRGQVKSCGCWNVEVARARTKTHGATSGGTTTPEFRTWCEMRRRCTDSRRSCYADYGGRGIRVHPAWLHDFERFLADVGPRPGAGFVIDRIDPNGHYEPGNVRWARAEHMNDNKRSSKLVTYRGATKALGVWVRELGLKYDLAHHRLDHGWSPEAAFEHPSAKRRSGNKKP